MTNMSAETDYGFLASAMQNKVSVVKNTSEVMLDISGLPSAKAIGETLVSVLTPLTMRELPVSLSPDRIAEAFEGLLFLRVVQVNGRPLCPHPALNHKLVEYPAVLFPLLRAIGEVNDTEDAVLVKLRAAGPLTRFEDKKYDWESIVETLRDLVDYGQPNGMELAYGLPKGRDGRLSVILLCVENERVKSSSGKANPADLLIRSAYDFVVSDYVWGAIRWEYQSISDYRYQLQQLVRASFRIVS